MPRQFLVLSLIILAFQLTHQQSNTTVEQNVSRKRHGPSLISQGELVFVETLSDVKHLQEVAKNLLIPRVPGTKSHGEVRDYIMDCMFRFGYHVETDNFIDNVPIMGKVEFDNIIATTNPRGDNYLVLACHYDSKYFPSAHFVGATDSAIPCAMLINLAKTMRNFIKLIKRQHKYDIMFLFFDGEEAFDKWSPTDSLYGSRHLADKWDKEKKLNKISLMVLLDLLGCPNPKFYNFFKETEDWYLHMLKIEKRLEKVGLLQKNMNSGTLAPKSNQYFQPSSSGTIIEDDHTPFIALKVPVIHLIPIPFPEEWHTINDNENIIDYTTVENINRILRVFLLEYLEIEWRD